MKTENKIVIDLNAEKIVDLNMKLGVENSMKLLEVFADLTKQINEHLNKVVMASYISLASKIKMEVEMNDYDDDSKISNKRFKEIVEEITK